MAAHDRTEPFAGHRSLREDLALGRQGELLGARRDRAVHERAIRLGGPGSGHLKGPRDVRGRA